MSACQESGHVQRKTSCPLSANGELMHRSMIGAKSKTASRRSLDQVF